MPEKILIFIDWYRPGYKAGGPITSVANLVDHLAGDYDFYILTRNTDYGVEVSYEGIEPNQWIQMKEFVNVCYLSKECLNRRSIFELAKEADCQIWLVNGIYSGYFSILPLLMARKTILSTLIVSPRGMLSPHALKVKGLKKRLYLRVARMLNLYKRVRFHATNLIEAEAIGQVLGTGHQVRIAPNLSVTTSLTPEGQKTKTKGSLSMIFLGRMSPEKNTLKALEAIGQITSGKLTFHLVGEIGDPDYWALCEDQIKKMPTHVKVIHEGPVPPDQLADLLGGIHLLFLPTTGENFGHAILECLSNGLPVIISDQTPWSGLSKSGAGEVLPLDQELQFVEAITRYLQMDQKEYDTSSKAARQFAKRIIQDPEPIEMTKKLFHE